MRTLAAGNKATRHRALKGAGFTLVELLVVLTLIALATATVSLSLPDNDVTALRRDSERLAALFETARARSRASQQAVTWSAGETGFDFKGLTLNDLPSRWLDPRSQVLSDATVTLGPEPIIPAQAVAVFNRDKPQLRVWVATDGLRAFEVVVDEPVTTITARQYDATPSN